MAGAQAGSGGWGRRAGGQEGRQLLCHDRPLAARRRRLRACRRSYRNHRISGLQELRQLRTRPYRTGRACHPPPPSRLPALLQKPPHFRPAGAAAAANKAIPNRPRVPPSTAFAPAGAPTRLPELLRADIARFAPAGAPASPRGLARGQGRVHVGAPAGAKAAALIGAARRTPAAHRPNGCGGSAGARAGSRLRARLHRAGPSRVAARRRIRSRCG